MAKIKIIDELRHSGKTATQKQYAVLRCPDRRLTSEEIAFILEAKDNAQLLIDHPLNFNNLERSVKIGLKINKPFQYNIILKAYYSPTRSASDCDEEGMKRVQGARFKRNGYFNPVKIDFDDHKSTMFYIESNKDYDESQEPLAPSVLSRIKELIRLIKFGFSHIETELRIQSSKKKQDGFSCPIFSIQASKAMLDLGTAALVNYFPPEERVADENNVSKSHPRFFERSQSMQMVAKNLENEDNHILSVSSKKEIPLEDYIKNYLITVENKDKSSGKTIEKNKIVSLIISTGATLKNPEISWRKFILREVMNY